MVSIYCFVRFVSIWLVFVFFFFFPRFSWFVSWCERVFAVSGFRLQCDCCCRRLFCCVPPRSVTKTAGYTRSDTHTHTRISSSAWLSFWFGFCFIVFFLVAFDSTRGPNCSIQFVWLKMKREIESKRLPKISATIQRRSMWYVCSCVGVCWAEKDSIFVSINLLSLFYMCKIASGRAKFEKRNARRWKKWAMSTDSSLAYNAGFRRDCHNFRQNFFIFIHILQYTYNSFVWLADSVRVSCAHLLGPE